jgi:hypothetical protein
MSLVVMACALLMGTVAAAAAQDQDISFSDVKLRELGLPEVTVTVGEDGVDAPSQLAAGYYLITLQPTKEYSAYLDIMQPPADLSADEATNLALQAARDDLAQPGWVYLGGTNTFEVGVPTSFAVYLAPGEYAWAASYYAMEQGSEEVMTLAPLTVTGGEGTPAAATPVVAEASPVASAPRGDVTLIMTDNPSFLISSDTVPTGPQLWEVTNTGELQSHHVVMVRIPDALTEDDIVSGFGSLFSGTPTASPPVSAQFTYVGYAALQSGGTTTWQEFDLDPGSYAVLCFIVDPETGVPHLMDGMVKTFTVE